MKTPRQNLILDAAAEQRVNGCSAHEALESVTDSCRSCATGTLGAAMLAYYQGCNDRALDRLISAVKREAR